MSLTTFWKRKFWTFLWKINKNIIKGKEKKSTSLNYCHVFPSTTFEIYLFLWSKEIHTFFDDWVVEIEFSMNCFAMSEFMWVYLNFLSWHVWIFQYGMSEFSVLFSIMEYLRRSKQLSTIVSLIFYVSLVIDLCLGWLTFAI